MINYDKFVFNEIRRIGKAWVDKNPDVPIDAGNIQQLFEKIGEMSYRRLADKKSVTKILEEIGVNPLDYPATELADKLSKLHISGKYFYDESHRKVYIKGTTDFMLYKYFLEGSDITPLLRQRAENGCNMVRIIGMVSWFDYTPQKYGQMYYDKITEFLDLVNSYEMYVYWTVFADTQIVMPKLEDQLNHFNKVVTQLKERNNVFGELVNEPYAHDNATADPFAFTRPIGIAFSSGSYNDHLGAKVTPKPHWDFHDFHAPRKDVKRVADQCVSTNPNYINGMAILSGEPDKFGGPNSHNPKIYLTDPDVSRQMAVTAEGTCCGYVYHTSAGNFSTLWNDVEIECCPFR